MSTGSNKGKPRHYALKKRPPGHCRPGGSKLETLLRDLALDLMLPTSTTKGTPEEMIVVKQLASELAAVSDVAEVGEPTVEKGEFKLQVKIKAPKSFSNPLILDYAFHRLNPVLEKSEVLQKGLIGGDKPMWKAMLGNVVFDQGYFDSDEMITQSS